MTREEEITIASKFKVKKPKFDPKTLKPFDRVLCRYTLYTTWHCATFSHIKEDTDTDECKFKTEAVHMITVYHIMMIPSTL